MPIHANATKLSILLDFDGCTSTEEARARLISRVIETLKTSPQITKLEVSIGSTRGLSFENDFHASHVYWLRQDFHESCAILGTVFIEDLKRGLNEHQLNRINLTFDSMLMGDVLNNLECGESFKLMVRHQASYDRWSIASGSSSINGCRKNGMNFTHIRITPINPAPSEGQSKIEYSSDRQHCDDTFKILMLYMQMQQKALLNPLEKFVLDFYDDRADILSAIQKFYGAHLELIPSNCCLRIHQFYIAEYEPELLQDSSDAACHFIGTGKVNRFYAADVHNIALVHSTNVPLSSEDPFKMLQRLIVTVATERAKPVISFVKQSMFSSSPATAMNKENEDNSRAFKKARTA